ncbi:MAG: FecR family protein, partial [Tannerellaceae bacterium]|nr:FecR family protein [Tannerellaceae bacterium]
MSDHQKERFNQLMGRYLTGDLDEKSSKELTSLLNESPVRRKEYDLAVKYYARLLSARFENRRETNYRTLSRQLGLSSSGRKFSMLRKIATIAAVAVLLLAMGLSVYLHTSSHTELQEKYTEIVVPSGSQSKLALADGTQVYLNAGSTLRYFSTLASTVRNVFLEGEAYFEVAANPEKPFIVHTSQLEVKVLGTEFNVKSYPEESNVEVSLLGGKVEVTAGATADKVQLMPDQLYVFNKENNTYEVQDMDVSRS